MPQFDSIYTYENIQNRKMSVVPQGLDRREGSVIWTTVAANSMEMALAYMQMGINQQNAFPDTANREFLIRHCALRGITPYPPSATRIEGVFYSDVTKGTLYDPSEDTFKNTRFTADNTKLVYRVVKPIVNENNEKVVGHWELVCEIVGTVGNLISGKLIPVDEIQALGSASIVGIIEQGDDEESTEALRSRYMESLQAQPFAGNKAAYREMCRNIDEVGACKVFRAYNDQAGHVGLCILNDELNPPDEATVSSVQKEIDPKNGDGSGMAPIDHQVHVFGAGTTPIEVYVKVKPIYANTRWEDISQTITDTINAYFLDLIKTWDSVDQLYVRPSHIIARLLGVDMIVDVKECTVNGKTDNVPIDPTSVPKVGVVSGEVVYTD